VAPAAVEPGAAATGLTAGEVQANFKDPAPLIEFNPGQ
jgi:hypothetical protein